MCLVGIWRGVIKMAVRHENHTHKYRDGRCIFCSQPITDDSSKNCKMDAFKPNRLRPGIFHDVFSKNMTNSEREKYEKTHVHFETLDTGKKKKFAAGKHANYNQEFGDEYL